MKKIGGGEERGKSLNRFPTETSVRSKLRDKNVPQRELYALSTGANYLYKNGFWIKLLKKTKVIKTNYFLECDFVLKMSRNNHLRNIKRNQTKLLNHNLFAVLKN